MGVDSSSEEEFGESFTNVFSEGAVVGSFVLANRVFNLGEDLDTVDAEVVTNVVDESPWVGEDGGHLLEFREIGNDAFAVGESVFHLKDTGSDGFESLELIGGISFPEKCDSAFDISEDGFSILDAVLDVLKALSVDGSQKDANDDLFNFCDVNLDCFLSGRCFSRDLGGSNNHLIN